ncbi:hypothetical protein BGZ49_004435 [Haplosporangium sp. Z 27]|nr:hypothetical protein BGZ49_004435 [Haplosporangium sp. Z 27]
MFRLLFEEKATVIEQTPIQEAPLEIEPPSTRLMHPAMYQALDVTEITVHIRKELRGADLKSMVLVNHLWWKTFGPYLWENIYIDANPEQDDHKIIFRNGLAARCLTLSLYDHLDSQGVASYVAEKCRNITQLHLKLFSPDLVIIDTKSKQARYQKDESQLRRKEYFALKEECATDLLDNLFKKFPYVSDLTISIGHEDIQPEVLWCLTTLPRLRKLTVNGGLRADKYIIRKNWRCNWHLLMRIARECPFIESLSVAWESHKDQALSDEETMDWMSNMFSETGESSETEMPKTGISIPAAEQIQSLQWLNISECELYNSLLDIAYASCPNLRGISFRAVKVTPIILKDHIKVLSSSCPRLRFFEFKDFTKNDQYSSVLLGGPLLNVSTLTLDVGGYDKCDFDKERLWKGVHSITTLTLCNIFSYELLFDIMSNMSGLTHLTLSGYFNGKSTYHGYSTVQSYTDNDRSLGMRLPPFACQDTLQFLDVTKLDIGSLKCHKLFFDRVQALPQLKRLEINNRHVQDARIEETWTDHDEDPDLFSKDSFYPDKVIDPRDIINRRCQNLQYFHHAYAHTKDRTRGPEGQSTYYYYYRNVPSSIDGDETEYEALLTAVAAAIPDKIFCMFPSVEFLYIHDDEPIRDYWNQEHYISEHIAGALVEMMPKLKVLALDKALGVGLKRVKQTYPHIIFDLIQA